MPGDRATERDLAAQVVRCAPVRRGCELGQRCSEATRPRSGHHPLQQVPGGERSLLATVTLVKGARRYPFVSGKLNGPTPEGRLNLQPGELVRIKSKAEIERTLNRKNRNRGLSFDGNMSPYCGRTARVRATVTKIIDERTGEMTHFSNECVLLEGVVCTGEYMQFCPRRIYPYWRELWLERV
jgi:hypothetical protein